MGWGTTTPSTARIPTSHRHLPTPRCLYPHPPPSFHLHVSDANSPRARESVIFINSWYHSIVELIVLSNPLCLSSIFESFRKASRFFKKRPDFSKSVQIFRKTSRVFKKSSMFFNSFVYILQNRPTSRFQHDPNKTAYKNKNLEPRYE